MSKLIRLLTVTMIGLQLARAQDTGARMNLDGLRIYSLGIASSYSSLTLPQGQFGDVASNIGVAALNYSGDLATTYSGSFGWRRTRNSSTISILYSPNYTSYKKYPEWNSFTHGFVIDVGRPLRVSSRATLTFSIATNIDDFRQYSTAPATTGSLLATPGGLASAFGAIGSDSDPTSGVRVSRGLDVVDSPARLLIYGNRMLTATARTALQYDMSQRWKMSVSVGTSRTQRLPGSEANQMPTIALASQATLANVSVETSYSLSRASDIGVELNTNRSFSSFENAYATAVNSFLSRRLHRNWSLRLNGGAGFYAPLTKLTLYAPPTGVQLIAGSMLGFKGRSTSLAVTVQRTMSESYAVAGKSSLVSGAVARSLRPQGWLVGANVIWQQFDGSRFQKLTTWQGAANFNRMLNPQLQLQLQYSYSTYQGTFGAASYELARSGVRLGLRWSPRRSIL